MNPNPRFCWLFLAALFPSLAAIVCGQQPHPQKLIPGRQIELEISGTETQQYNFNLKKGEFFQIRVEQKGADVELKLKDANGKVLARMDSPNGIKGPETLTWAADAKADFVLEILEVSGTLPKQEKRKYTIKREAAHRATQKDRRRVEVERLFAEGMATFYAGGQDKAAIQKLEPAFVGWQELNDRYLAGLTGQLVGARYRNVGEKQKALEYFNRALPLSRISGNRSLEATTLNDIGDIYNDFGESQKALDYNSQALPLWRALADKSGEGTTINNIGNVYYALGENNKALDYYLRALPLLRAVDNKEVEATTLNNIGAIYDSTGEKQKALDFYNQALLLRRGGDKRIEATILNNIGIVYIDLGEKQKALDHFDRALRLHREVGASEATALHNIGLAYAHLGERQKALDHYNQALLLRRAIGDRPGEAKTLNNLMREWEAAGSPKIAVLYGKQSVNVYQTLRGNIKDLDAEIQKTYLGTIAKTYRHLAGLLIHLGRIAEADQVLALLKEEETLSYVRRDDNVAKGFLQTLSLTEEERAALARYNEMADRITAIGKEFGELEAERKKYKVGNFPRQARYDELKSRLADATTLFQKFLDELKVTFGQRDERVVQVDSSLQYTLKRLNAKRTAVVSTIVGEEKLNLIVTTANTQRAHTIETPAAEINQLVAEFRKALTDHRIDPRPAGQKLYDILVKRLEDDLKGIDADTILWSLDGTLRYIPVAAIWDKDKGYLTERFSNVVLTLASRDTLGLPVSDKAAWKALGVGVSKPTEGFTALAAVPDELDCIITDKQNKTVSAKPKCKTGVINGRKLLDEKFTATAFENALGRYSILHVASHFKLNPGNDRDSFLLLGGGDRRRFTVENLRNVLLTDVELMVLSACNTATPGGEKANGVEIEGFGAVAQRQGAKAVLATLWPVADESTRDLMVRFYSLYDKSGLTKAEAMRQAQLEMLRGTKPAKGNATARGVEIVGDGKGATKMFEPDPNAPYAHPYYWAPFVLFGNWR